MSTPAELVASSFQQAQTYANQAQAKLTTFLGGLADAVTTAPTIDVTFQPVAAPGSITVPARPGALETIEEELEFDRDGSIAGAMPTALTETAPEIDIDDFTEEAPTVDFGDAPTLDFGDAPTLTFGAVPTVPDVGTIEIPESPTIELPTAPTYLELTTPTFAGVDLHEEFLENLMTVPTLDLVAPTPYTYAPGAAYSSELLTALKTSLQARLAGGTGLPTAIEAALWDRARERELRTAQANIDQVMRDGEALGFVLPAGVTNEAIRRETRAYFDKVSDLSRDIAVKQADLEQQNLQQTIAHAMQLEGTLIDQAYKLEALAFENAKAVAANAIEIYNANVAAFQALLARYEALATAYKTIIDGELAKVEVYKAQIAAEQAKADTNRSLVQQYEAEVRARLALVEIFKGQLDGARIQMEIESARISAAGERVKAYVAGINGETAKVEAYKVSVQAQGAKAEAFKAAVDAKLATVQVFKVKADAFSAKANAQGERARAQVAYYEGVVRAKSAEWDGWRARVTAEGERIRAVGMKSQSALDGYRADIVSYQAQVDQNLKHWETQIKQYEATATYTLNAQKLNSEIVHANNTSILEASKVGAQVYAQLTASAYSMIHTSAGVSAGASTSIGYNYSNQTSDSPPSLTAI